MRVSKLFKKSAAVVAAMALVAMPITANATEQSEEMVLGNVHVNNIDKIYASFATALTMKTQGNAGTVVAQTTAYAYSSSNPTTLKTYNAAPDMTGGTTAVSTIEAGSGYIMYSGAYTHALIINGGRAQRNTTLNR